MDATNKRVGIGTGSPNELLHVSGGNVLLDNNQYIRWIDSGGTIRNILQLASGGTLYLLNNDGGDGGDIVFGTKTGAGESVRIDSSGKVGIGTTNPDNYLEVQYSDGTAYSSGTEFKGITIHNAKATADGFMAGLNFKVNAGDTTMTISTIGSIAESSQNSALIFQTENSNSLGEKMRITSDGNVGIGTSIPSYGIDVEKANGKTFAAFGSLYPTYITGNSPYIGFNLYYTTEWHMGKGSAGNYGGVIGLEPSSGDFRVFTSPSGSEGDIIDLGGYERIRIQQNGNVGIGTTSPGEKLEVEGKIKFGTQLAGENYQGILDTVDTISEGSESRDDVMITTDGGVIIKADKNNNGISGMGAFAVYDNTSHLFTITEAGRVGIGTTEPGAKLEVAGGGSMILIDSETSVSGQATLLIRSDYSSDENLVFNFRSEGNAYADGSWTGPADYAEYFYSDDTSLKPGELVCIAGNNNIKRCSKGEVLIGVVSTKPGVVGIYADDVTDAAQEYEKDPHWVKVGLMGQIPVKVSVRNGIIKAGDQLTAGNNGIAVKGESSGTLLMIALEDTIVSGKIKVLIK